MEIHRFESGKFRASLSECNMGLVFCIPPVGSSKLLSEDLKMKLIYAFIAGKCYKKILKHFQLSVFTV